MPFKSLNVVTNNMGALPFMGEAPGLNEDDKEEIQQILPLLVEQAVNHHEDVQKQVLFFCNMDNYNVSLIYYQH